MNNKYTMDIVLREAQNHEKQMFGDDATIVKIKENGHTSILLLSRPNAQIILAAPMLYNALHAYFDMQTPSAVADKMARLALKLANPEAHPTNCDQPIFFDVFK